MSLNNPAPILHQNIMAGVNKMSNKPKQQKSNGLLSSTKKANSSSNEDISSPVTRVAMYVKAIQKQREEMKNG